MSRIDGFCLGSLGLALLGGGCQPAAPSQGSPVARVAHASPAQTSPNVVAFDLAVRPHRGFLAVKRGDSLRFEFSNPYAKGGTHASDPTVRVDIKDSSGAKAALTQTPLRSDQTVNYVADVPGYLSVHTCQRPQSLDHRANAWQLASHCEIAHVAVLDDKGRRVLTDEHLTRKIGLPIELRPYASTARLGVGSELSLRLYHQGVPVAGRELVATGPSGQTQRSITEERGMGRIQIDAIGPWVVEATVSDETMPKGIASVRFVFEVPDPSEPTFDLYAPATQQGAPHVQ